MSERSAMFLVFTGLILTMFGVGGVENSVTDTELGSSLAVSLVGTLIMWAGTLGLRNSNQY
jgi:hypothetical protein